MRLMIFCEQLCTGNVLIIKSANFLYERFRENTCDYSLPKNSHLQNIYFENVCMSILYFFQLNVLCEYVCEHSAKLHLFRIAL